MNTDVYSIAANIERVIIGKRDVILRIIAALLCNGHVLLEDVPGTGKTRLAAALAKSIGGRFNRIQLTPDVMPQDITGFTMLNPETRQFEFKEGAAYCNFLLADEINRASPKVQSGLLEIMDERQTSVDGKTHLMPRPFMTLATQNPVETYGTYHLPEAQMDRFLLRVSIGYMQKEEEVQLLDTYYHQNKEIGAVVTPERIVELQDEANAVYCHPIIREYIINITTATRRNENIKLGISPRGSMGLCAMAKAWALIEGRNFVTPDDVIVNAESVLAHRLMLSPRGKGTPVEVILREIVREIPLPQAGISFDKRL